MEFTPGTMTALFWSLMGMLAFLKSLLPKEFYEYVEECKKAWMKRWSIYHTVDVHEDSNEFGNNQLYLSTYRYLGDLAATAGAVTAECPRNSAKISFSLAANGEMRDEFRGCSMRWKHSVTEQKEIFSRHREKKRYTLTVHKRDRVAVSDYLKLVHDRGLKLAEQDREKKINTNLRDYWKSVSFMHPSTFDTVAMEPARKQELMADLRRFMNGQEFYSGVGRAWKRGYLLYGPPGTGKSSLIAAIANFTGYDLYDLELTKVSSNMELRQLLINISDRAIIVVEDIDCSLQFDNRHASDDDGDSGRDESNGGKSRRSQVTLSGFLNFTDGLWSCCGNQRIFIFTTNYIDKLDPALLRPGRMDMRIHMSYCSFEIFKVLSSNYLKIKEHELYPEIEELLISVQITPADLIEVLVRHGSDSDLALENLVETLKKQQQDDSSSEVSQEVAAINKDEISDLGNSSSTSAE